MSTIKGTAKRDILHGTGAAESVLGLAGNDDLFGSGGNDMLRGAAGNDKINGGSGNDKIFGNGGNDSLIGASGDDTLDGGSGNDDLKGGAGNDTLLTGKGTDHFHGGTGIDGISYLGTIGDVTVDLASGTGSDAATGDTYDGIENVTGSYFTDVIIGDGKANKIAGDFGSDILKGGGGNDTLLGGDDSDTLDGGPGADVLNGGAGHDTAEFSSAVIIDLQSGQNTGEAQGDTYISIEEFKGSAFSDQLFGDGTDNLFSGGAGDDVLYGFGGNDFLNGQGGIDFIVGGDGNDLIAPGADSDKDSLFGGTGDDTVYYLSWFGGALSGVQVDLTANTSGGAAAGDSYSGIENIIGGFGDDTLRSGVDGKANGYLGDDTILDSTGTELLIGGPGSDLLTDKFLGVDDGLTDIFGLGLNMGRDSISGFDQGTDKLGFGQDFNLLTVSASQVTNNTTGAADAAGPQFIYEVDTHILWFDEDGLASTVPSVQVAVLLGFNGTLTSADFQHYEWFPIF